MTTTNISISRALESDLPAMIALRCGTLEEDVLNRFLLDDRHAEAIRKETESLTVSLGKRFTNPTNRCQIDKAIETQTGKLAGWSLVRWEESNKIYALPEGDSSRPGFLNHYTRELRKKWFEITAGKPHVVLGALYVRADLHRQGIGRQLIEYLYSTYDLDKELVIVQTRPTSEGFYHKLGWTTVDSTDVDLSEWGGKGMGYGMHRSPQMLRYPG